MQPCCHSTELCTVPTLPSDRHHTYGALQGCPALRHSWDSTCLPSGQTAFMTSAFMRKICPSPLLIAWNVHGSGGACLWAPMDANCLNRDSAKLCSTWKEIINTYSLLLDAWITRCRNIPVMTALLQSNLAGFFLKLSLHNKESKSLKTFISAFLEFNLNAKFLQQATWNLPD